VLKLKGNFCTVLPLIIFVTVWGLFRVQRSDFTCNVSWKHRHWIYKQNMNLCRIWRQFLRSLPCSPSEHLPPHSSCVHLLSVHLLQPSLQVLIPFTVFCMEETPSDAFCSTTSSYPPLVSGWCSWRRPILRRTMAVSRKQSRLPHTKITCRPRNLNIQRGWLSTLF